MRRIICTGLHKVAALLALKVNADSLRVRLLEDLCELITDEQETVQLEAFVALA
jgi:hypothetical protein